MERIEQPTIIVIFGVSGDLSKRSLLPALEAISRRDAFAEKTRVLGLSRRELDFDSIVGESQWLRDHLELRQHDPLNGDDYVELSKRIDEIEGEFGESAQRLFYLSLPPSAATTVVSHLGESNLASAPQTKLLLEKPFGTDYASAVKLIDQLKEHFTEDQTYRIDHFLAKEMTQNLMVFRAANPLFSRTWNRDFIESIDIVLSETLDIEGRAGFYEQTGVVRDVVQSHMLQLAALTLMDLPDLRRLELIPDERRDALRQLTVDDDIDTVAVRGQYQGYRDEVENPDSNVETFTRIELRSTDPRWRDVPIRLIAGKALDRTTTEICITYRNDFREDSDKLIMRVQPNEGIELDMWAKRPGYDKAAEQRRLAFDYKQDGAEVPKAYERVFMDAMRGDHMLFATSDEILESWRLMDPILAHWQERGGDGLKSYPKGVKPNEI